MCILKLYSVCIYYRNCRFSYISVVCKTGCGEFDGTFGNIHRLDFERKCLCAKTVKSGSNIGEQKTVRLISGRNSPIYSFGVDRITEAEPNAIGKMVLDIWNERVSGIRQYFKFARTVVLVKGQNYDEYLIFETETVRYDADQFVFIWNDRGNLEGYTKETHFHKFTWQPHGSQFTIIENIPKERYHLKIKVPEKLNKTDVLKTLAFDKSWVTKLD